MKKSAGIFLLLFIAMLIFLGKNKGMLDRLYIYWNHLMYSSPIIWNNMKIYYSGDNTVFIKDDKGPLFITWKNTPSGFLGFSNIPTNETIQKRIDCIKKNSLYNYISDWSETIDNNNVHYINAINGQSNEKVIFIVIPTTNTLVMFQGTEEGYAYFLPTIKNIKF